MEEVILNQIEAMTTNELEALYGRLETEAFRLKVSISAVALELEARIKSRRITSLGVEEQTASGNTRLTVGPSPPENPRAWGKPVPDHLGNDPEGVEDIPVVSPETDEEEDARLARRRRGPDSAPRATCRSSCCGSLGHRRNSKDGMCFGCRPIIKKVMEVHQKMVKKWGTVRANSYTRQTMADALEKAGLDFPKEWRYGMPAPLVVDE